MMKPQNNQCKKIMMPEAATEESKVWNREATKRNKDIPVNCTAKNVTNWRKNLETKEMINV